MAVTHALFFNSLFTRAPVPRGRLVASCSILISFQVYITTEIITLGAVFKRVRFHFSYKIVGSAALLQNMRKLAEARLTSEKVSA